MCPAEALGAQATGTGATSNGSGGTGNNGNNGNGNSGNGNNGSNGNGNHGHHYGWIGAKAIARTVSRYWSAWRQGPPVRGQGETPSAAYPRQIALAVVLITGWHGALAQRAHGSAFRLAIA